MGRLDDIAARNQKALGGDNTTPAADVPAFTLPSQRTSGTAM
jgi:hypothetical protein